LKISTSEIKAFSERAPAFEEMAARLQRIKAESGPEAAAVYTGRGSFELAM